VLYFPDTGAVKVRRIKEMKNDTLIKRETSYRKQVTSTSSVQSGGVDLF
jgi:chemotaxis protein CheD